MKKLPLPLILLSILSLSSTSYATDFEEDRITFAEAEPLSHEEMQGLRGGFIDPTGIFYNFAVNVRTSLEGIEIFSRNIFVSAAESTGGRLHGTSTASLSTEDLSNALAVSMLDRGSGITVRDTKGNTAMILNETSRGVPSSIIMNTTSDLNIAQSVGLTLTLKDQSSLTALSQATVRAALAQRSALHMLGF